MRKLTIAGIILNIILISSCEKRDIGELAISALIGEVDSIKRPIDPSLITQVETEGGDEYRLTINKSKLDKLEDLQGGVDAFLIGGTDNPKAVSFYLHKRIEKYIIPFEKVNELDKPMRIIKISSRFYKVLSNRSSEGQFTKVLQ